MPIRKGKRIYLIKYPIKEAVKFSLKMVEKMQEAQEWAFDKSLGLRELRKKLKNYEDFQKFSEEYKEKQLEVLLVQREWNDFWTQKDEKFRAEFHIENEYIIRRSNYSQEKYIRRLKLIAKNVSKIGIALNSS